MRNQKRIFAEVGKKESEPDICRVMTTSLDGLKEARYRICIVKEDKVLMNRRKVYEVKHRFPR